MKLIILDRDGVINEDSPDYIKSVDEWHPIPGSLEAIALLNQFGYTVAVATNQSGLARGFYDETTLNAIHDKMRLSAKTVGGHIDSIFYCPHGPNDHCDCRKPKPGLLQQIAAHYQISLTTVPYVGDSYRDLDAANRAGAVPILVLTGNGHKALSVDSAFDFAHFDNLLAFAKTLKNS
ncbi:D-glycero-beta-D-manno-heptose 1,7-bisphosphate 7-phosphatase [Candidatus Berkiella aquae]|uniref:D,D-heptose 1,7-bisphosphate phosphatase n=1 Tax=Candidatus Berkiella aquae TaxID=295108 RepID=A0A0Q9YQ24_9GAMM|nr:D-glycero-beta-D-manno-heptose 1,7-bisphosphate 7-phosphatase [Candidatus Berkiella aquae]MCS5709805.1 D-glycero-beta-D-manno-heptose 1,7-bisphosphate 7-phosphatase [Candidatus Berkiella aquae]